MTDIKIPKLLGISGSLRKASNNTHCFTAFSTQLQVWPRFRSIRSNAYQWLLYIPLHAGRHLNQLLRVAHIAEQVE